MRARRAGDRGWLLELPAGLAPARAGEAVRQAFPQLEEVVPGHETLLVVGDVAAEQLVAAAGSAPRAEDRRPATIEIPVIYDGADLDEVGELTGLSVEEVLDRLAAETYTALFLGFQPGFAYLTGLDEKLVVPRRAQPRERVPAGSVAIAGPYAGVYPRESPGGWRLLGHTELELFDPDRKPPALIQAGDLVRFVPR